MNRRNEHRFAAGQHAEAIILGHPDVKVDCCVRDFSPSGMCIAVDQEIPLGRIVKVDWDEQFLVGRVQSAEQDSGNYRVGLELLYFSKWSKERTDLFSVEKTLAF